MVVSSIAHNTKIRAVFKWLLSTVSGSFYLTTIRKSKLIKYK